MARMEINRITRARPGVLERGNDDGDRRCYYQSPDWSTTFRW